MLMLVLLDVCFLECQMEILLNTTWPRSYVNTQLTLPCMISECKQKVIWITPNYIMLLFIANIVRTCDPNGIWDPSPIASYNRCARNPAGI